MASRRGAIAAWLVLVALCIAQILQARFVADLSSFLPSAPTREQRMLVDQLRDGALSRVMLIGIEGADAAKRAELSRALANALRQDPRFVSASNGSQVGVERERDLILRYRYVLSPRMTPERFSVEGLRESIGATLELLASPAGMMMKSLVPRDPTGEVLAVAEQLQPQEGPRMEHGVWVSREGDRALLLARTRANGSDTDAQAEALRRVAETFARLRGDGNEARLLVTGPGVFSVKAREMIKQDVERLAAISMAIVAALLLAAYRSPRALALGLAPVVSGALAGVAAVSLGFGEVHGITLGFGTTLIGEAVDYSIYLFVQSERAGEGDAWIVGFWPTIRLGVLTSIAGFSALLFAGLPGLAQLGVYSITGLLVAAAVTRYVLPAMLPAGFRIRDLSPLGRSLLRQGARLSRWRWGVAILAVIALAVLASHGRNLWDRDVASLNPITRADRQLDEQLRSSLGASDARLMVSVAGDSADSALQAAERAGRALDRLVANGQLAGYDTPAKILPSAATQRERLDTLPRGDALRERLRDALKGSPLRAERLEPFIADVDRAVAQGVISREQVSGTALEIAVDGLLFRDAAGRWTALLGLRAPAGQAIDAAAVRDTLAASGTEATLLDIKGELDRLYAGYFERAVAMSLAGLVAIVLLLAAMLRDGRRVARIMAPLLAGVLVAAAWQLLWGQRLSLLHLVGLLLVVAIGSNYALFFDRLDAQLSDKAARTLASLLLANATTVASFGVLALSRVPVLHAIGSTVAIGAFATLMFAAMLHVYPLESGHADPLGAPA